MLMTQRDLPALLKLLADPTRLRILALLEREELSVGELVRGLGLAQSRVSNHLRSLREAGLLDERHVGSSTYLRFSPGGDLEGNLWQAARSGLPSVPEHAADLARLESVLAGRSAGPEFFDALAESYETVAGDFETGQARQRAAAQLMPAGYTVADVGCGTGYVSRALTGLASRLILVDQSERMLEEARRRLGDAGCELDLRRGAFDALPLADGEVDGIVASMVAHHLPELAPALAEMRRALRPGGSAVLVDLLPHGESWMHEALGDRHLGLESSDVVRAFRRAGFEDVVLDAVDDRYRPTHPDGHAVSLPLFLVRGRVPAANRS